MDWLIKICIAAAVIIAAILIIFIAFAIKKEVESILLLRNTKRNVSMVHRLLYANYGSSRVMRNMIFPYNFSPNSRLFKVDAININHGGVLLITIKNYHGMIENPFHGDWRQFFAKKIDRLPNPLEINAKYAGSINMQLKSMNISNVPVRSLVVYLDPKTRFKNRIEQIVLIDRLRAYIHDMNKNRFLSSLEMRNVSTALKKCACRPKNAHK